MQKVIYDNQLRLKDIFCFAGYMVIFSIVVGCVYWLMNLHFSKSTEYILWDEHYFKCTIILIVGMSIFQSIILYNTYRNQYRLVGDTITFREYMLFYKTVDITIPISTINEVKLLRTVSHPIKHIQLRTANATYSLSCITHREELFKELVSKVNKKQQVIDKLYFYKQKKC